VTLRTKLVAALAMLAAAATVTIGVFSYTATANQLQRQIDRSLDDTANRALHTPPDRVLGGPDPDGDQRLGGSRYDLVRVQLLGPDGRQYVSDTTIVLPASAREKEIATASLTGVAVRRTVTIKGQQYRMSTVSYGGGRGAVQVARSLAENQHVLGSLRDRILLAAGLVVVIGGLLGWLIARQVTRRLIRLTNTAEEVAQTGRLDVAVPVQGADEAGRLGVAFNEMLAALARSKEDQQRLVQDAGHELRTPLTSLRTNMSVLRRHELAPDARTQVLDDLESETRELTDLVNELVELATDRSTDEPATDVSLAEVADAVAARARRRSGREITVDVDDTVVVGRRQGIERAMSNLVDNALKFDERGTAPVEIVVRDGRVTVLDRGPGVDDGDLPHLFDRFYRSVNARSRPGSGLGLSIVREVATRHGGTVFAAAREGGGAAIGFTLPVAPPDGAG
jgi:two-component system sensor histidine kinase MprB